MTAAPNGALHILLGSFMQRRIASLFAGSAITAVSALGLAGATAMTAAPAAQSLPFPTPLARILHNAHFASPPTTAQCEARYTSPATRRRSSSRRTTWSRFTSRETTARVRRSSSSTPTASRTSERAATFDKGFGLPRPQLQDHPAGRQGAAVRPDQAAADGRLGEGDVAGRRVLPRDRAGGEHPAGRDPGAGNAGHPRLPADRQGRELRDRPPPRHGDHAELRRSRAGFPARRRS